jgi:acetyl esterase/lipase
MFDTLKSLLQSIRPRDEEPIEVAEPEGRFIDPRILGRGAATSRPDAPSPSRPAVLENFGGIVEESLTYKSTREGPLTMRVFRPRGGDASTLRAGIVFFHGGAWRRRVPKQFVPFATELAQRGVVAMCAEYRVLEVEGDAVPADAVEDALSAMRWARAQAARFHIDPTRLAAGGGSSGAHLALMTALRSDDVVRVGTAGSEAVGARPDALILLNAPLDFDGFDTDVPLAERRRYSPIHLLGADLPPTLLMHGTADAVIPFGQVTAFQRRATELGVPSLRVIPFEGRPHGFFNRGRGEAGDPGRVTREMSDFLAGLGWLSGR